MSHELEFETLSEPQIDAALESLPGWRRDGVKIRKEFELPSFPKAIEFVNRVAQVAEEFNHHPDIEIHYKKVDVIYWTHKNNATSKADVLLAGEIEKIAQ